MVDMLLPAVNWQCNHDAGTPGSATGSIVIQNGKAVLNFSAKGRGGFIYHANVTRDVAPYNRFCIEKGESSADWSKVAQCENDLEATGAHGEVRDMATQQSSGSGQMVTLGRHWSAVGIPALDPRKRASNVLHTSRIYLGVNPDGSVLYPGTFFNGTYYPIGKAGDDTQSHPWGANILNLQSQYNSAVDAQTNFSITLSVHRVWMWKE